MGDENRSKLNRLERDLPEGLLVTAAWLDERGYYPSLRKKYVDLEWLDSPVRGVYRRRRGSITWQHVVISLQNLLDIPLIVGGRTALELQGYAHFLSHRRQVIHLYGRERPPTWLAKLKLEERFIAHKSTRLFHNEPITRGLVNLSVNLETGELFNHDPLRSHFSAQRWGQWDWPLLTSTSERAFLELLDDLPDNESFHQVDMLAEGLASLSPRRLQKLLLDCRSVKVKRLFFFFADRHRHAWLKHLDKNAIDLGRGKRMLVKGGKLDPVYQITVPEDLDAVS